MTKLEVELTKLRKVARRTAQKLGMCDGMISISCVTNTMHVTIWKNGDIVESENGIPARAKATKETIHRLVREYKNSQS